MLLLNEGIQIILEKLPKIEVQKMEVSSHLINQYYVENSHYFKAIKGIEKQQLLPDLAFNYFNSKDLAANVSVNSFQAGVSIPIFFFGKSSKIAASKIEKDIANERITSVNLKLNAKYNSLLEELKRTEVELKYYYESGEKLANEILKTAISSFKNGEIDFFQYIQSIENSNQIKINYLSTLNSYNKIALDINYLNL